MRRRSAWFRLARGRDGNVAIIFALASLPLLVLMGAVINYGFATRLQVKLQAATDATALALCQMPLSATTAQLQAQATLLETGYMGASSGLTLEPLGVTSNPRQLTLRAHVPSPAVFPNVVGLSSFPVRASAQCTTPATFEIAFVLDNTGSMLSASAGRSKLQAAQQAAVNFVDYVKSHDVFSSATRMSVVPFAGAVALDPGLYRNASWVDTEGVSRYHWTNIDEAKARARGLSSRLSVFDRRAKVEPTWNWGGCFESLPYPQNVRDGVPTSNDTLYVPYFAPDEPGDGTVGESWWTAQGPAGGQTRGQNYPSPNSYINDGGTADCLASTANFADAEKQACKYANPTNPKRGTYLGIPNGPNAQCVSKPLQRLTADTAVLKTLISSMTAAGSTNIADGMMWGWRTLSPYSVFADGAGYGSGTRKIIVLMTDGANSWPSWWDNPNQSQYFPLGYVHNADGSDPSSRLPSGYQAVNWDGQRRAALDELTLEVCSNAKAAGISIYTVGFSIPSDPIDDQGLQLLQSCANTPKQAFVANDSDALIAAFGEIAQSIGSLRISQ